MEGVLSTESRPYDSTQEIRAMILAALPLPPLPVIVQQLDEDNRVVGEKIQTSHDVLSNLMLHACARNSPKENAERKRRQLDVLKSLLEQLCKLEKNPKTLYDVYCHHTSLHMATYIPADGCMPPMTYAPLSSVCKGDYAHRKMCDYMAGQAILLQENRFLCANDWLCREYADMLTINWGRLVVEGEQGRRFSAQPAPLDEETPTLLERTQSEPWRCETPSC